MYIFRTLIDVITVPPYFVELEIDVWQSPTSVKLEIQLNLLKINYMHSVMQIHKGIIIQVMKCHKWRKWEGVNRGLELVLGNYVKNYKYKLNKLELYSTESYESS